MAMTLKQIADFLQTQGMPCELVGNPATEISSVNTLEEARNRGYRLKRFTA